MEKYADMNIYISMQIGSGYLWTRSLCEPLEAYLASALRHVHCLYDIELHLMACLSFYTSSQLAAGGTMILLSLSSDLLHLQPFQIYVYILAGMCYITSF